jgi:hypothetical protein
MYQIVRCNVDCQGPAVIPPMPRVQGDFLNHDLSWCWFIPNTLSVANHDAELNGRPNT